MWRRRKRSSTTIEAQATDLGIQRAQMEHAIALLTGRPASVFSIATNASAARPVAVPFGVPSELLERRPDIAAAERRVAAENALIGVARAAYFPTVTLSGSAGYQSGSVANLFSGPAFVWSVGGSLAETLFDAGKREAVTEQAGQLSRRGGGLPGNRAGGHSGGRGQPGRTADFVGGTAATRTPPWRRRNVISSWRWTVTGWGSNSYLNVITAQTTLLSNQRTALTLQMEQLTSSVQLINALGGGWTTNTPAAPAGQ